MEMDEWVWYEMRWETSHLHICCAVITMPWDVRTLLPLSVDYFTQNKNFVSQWNPMLLAKTFNLKKLAQTPKFFLKIYNFQIFQKSVPFFRASYDFFFFRSSVEALYHRTPFTYKDVSPPFHFLHVESIETGTCILYVPFSTILKVENGTKWKMNWFVLPVAARDGGWFKLIHFLIRSIFHDQNHGKRNIRRLDVPFSTFQFKMARWVTHVSSFIPLKKKTEL